MRAESPRSTAFDHLPCPELRERSRTEYANGHTECEGAEQGERDQSHL